MINDESKRKIFEDNFRYIWSNDVTIEEEDAMETINGKQQLLNPQRINYHNKSSYIKKILNEIKNHENDENIDQMERVWVSYVTHQLKTRYCDINLFQTTPTNTFIACSWNYDENGINSPHAVAKELKTIFKKCVKINASILEAAAGRYLAHQLYESLNRTESAVILLTKDIQSNDQYYSKPNIYIELGYLLKQLGKENVLIIAENGVNIPTDIQDITRLEYSSNIYEIYTKIVDWLENINILSPNSKEKVYENFHAYIEQLMVDNKITQHLYNTIKNGLFKT